MIAPSAPEWPTMKSKLIDLINTRIQAAKTNNSLLESFAHVNLEESLRSLPDDWSTQPNNEPPSSDKPTG